MTMRGKRTFKAWTDTVYQFYKACKENLNIKIKLYVKSLNINIHFHKVSK